MNRHDIINNLSYDDIFLIAYEFFTPHFGMTKEQIIFSVGIDRIFEVYRESIFYINKAMQDEDSAGQTWLDGKYVKLKDLDEETYQARKKLQKYYYDEMIKCVNADKK